MIDAFLLDILACPACGGKIALDESHPKKARLICLACKQTYAVHNGIPVLVADGTNKPYDTAH